MRGGSGTAGERTRHRDLTIGRWARDRAQVTPDRVAITAFPMLASNANPYPQGEAWETGPFIDCSLPGAPRIFVPHPDLVFKIVFCTNGVTGTRRSSWGELKVLYR